LAAQVDVFLTSTLQPTSTLSNAVCIQHTTTISTKIIYMLCATAINAKVKLVTHLLFKINCLSTKVTLTALKLLVRQQEGHLVSKNLLQLSTKSSVLTLSTESVVTPAKQKLTLCIYTLGDNDAISSYHIYASCFSAIL